MGALISCESKANKQEIVVHVVGGRAEHQDPLGAVSVPREDLQVMKHESQVGGCSQSRGEKVERCEWFPPEYREGACNVWGRSAEGVQAHPRGISSHVLTLLGTLESP